MWPLVKCIAGSYSASLRGVGTPGCVPLRGARRRSAPGYAPLRGVGCAGGRGILSTDTISAGSAPGTTAGTREPCPTAGSASAGHGHTWERASPGRKTTERVPPGHGQRGAGGTWERVPPGRVPARIRRGDTPQGLKPRGFLAQPAFWRA